MKTLSDYMKNDYRNEKFVEDAEEGGFVVSFPELPDVLLVEIQKKKQLPML